MVALGRVCAALAALLLALAAGLVSRTPELVMFPGPLHLPGARSPPASATFQHLGSGLYKLDLGWVMTPWHWEVLDLFAFDLGGGAWALSDSGGGDSWLHAHASVLVASVQALLPAGATLTRVLLTHAHIDHAGGLAALRAAWPELKACVCPGGGARGQDPAADASSRAAGGVSRAGARVPVRRCVLLAALPALRLRGADTRASGGHLPESRPQGVLCALRAALRYAP